MTDELNKIINTINDIGFFATSKCNSKGEVKAIDKLRAYGLIEEPVKGNLRLTKEGHRCIELGSFENWLIDFDLKQKKQTVSVDNLSIINGDNNNVNQSL